ncbi:30S ribosomal protein S1 [Flavilitoribacter nigricans]|uniref:Small ribosomal subunit protein bS1 n=1 Tax=Flavilitoribacter nigricans (strain ATCC 23147 / DSM 23189 / NBRC 102662 / NCIMB 1420 / SS-2) TaxID=1122177 RepID=A0A2D0N4F6_FLAN2|nr:30S ribosomal protein S1 [Flavilitoribacter nigricans]PHN03266.1 30S ribosomal protein S1 [Flavilitoribacter nigricans DSM 23189 = NBRC 102662]
MLEEKDQEQQNNEVEETPQVETPEEVKEKAVAAAEEAAEETAEETQEAVEEAADVTHKQAVAEADNADEVLAEATKEGAELAESVEVSEAAVIEETAVEEGVASPDAQTEQDASVVDDAEEVEEDEDEDDDSEDEDDDEEGDDDDDEDEDEDEDEDVIDETPVLHDDFNWALSNKYGIAYTEDEKEQLLAQYDATLSSILENQIVSGKVTAINDGDVVLDINYKSDGLVSLSEFRDTPDLGVGDSVDVYVEQQEDARGQLVLSRRKAKLLRAWESIRDSYENGTVITGTIISKTKGGLIVDCSGLETFLPGSQIDIKPIIDYDAYVGKTMEFKVVKINEAIKNAVVSHKALIESDLAEQREAIIASLEKGQVLEGLVKNITDFGAFLDLGGVDGLLYITDISWGRINHPSEVLQLNQKINVVVLDFDENKKRISLGLKQLQPHPWEVLDDKIQEGSTVKGKIVNIEDYGAFLEIQPGVEGLIHVSEVSWSNQPINAREYFKLGQEYEAKVVTVDREDRKMSLSIKQLTNDPWDTIEDQFPINSRHTGEVKNLTPYGVFVELKEGIGGMVHISDLSWTKRYSHPSEFTKVGNDIDIMILEIDKDNRKLSLGHKQLEENPWDTFENVFPVGSYHEATVLRRDDRGAIVQLPYGLEAYAPLKHVRKEDNTLAEPDEVLTVKVIEFNRDDKRIMVSHLRYLDDIRREADAEVRKQVQAERKETKKAIKKTQSNVEKSTLGDLDVFSELKDMLNTDEEGGDKE